MLVLFGWGTGFKNTVSVSHQQWFSGGWTEVPRARGCQLINAAGESRPLALSSELWTSAATFCVIATRTRARHGLQVFCCTNVLSTFLLAWNCILLVCCLVAENVLQEISCLKFYGILRWDLESHFTTHFSCYSVKLHKYRKIWITRILHFLKEMCVCLSKSCCHDARVLLVVARALLCM